MKSCLAPWALSEGGAMPPTITVAAFVFGIVLLLAAIIGKELKIVAVEVPALTGISRAVVGVLGAILVGIALVMELSLAPEPAAAPAPPSTATAVAHTPASTEDRRPEQTTQPAGSLFSIGFDDNAGGWDMGTIQNERGTISYTIADGTYRWDVQASASGGYQIAIPKNAPAASDFVLQVEITRLRGDCYYGVIFRNHTSGYYLFLLREHSFGIYQTVYSPRQTTPLLSKQDSSSLISNTGNTLKVVARGPRIEAYINGVLVGEVTNADVKAGTAGLYANILSNEHSILVFDDFALSRP
jgi:hypothetical protein